MKEKIQGFTLVELLVVMGIMGILLAFSSVSLLRVQYQASVNTVFTNLVTDLSQQQLKAMTGDTQGRGTLDTYGIYLETNKYTMFHGTYTPGDATNSVITLSPQIQLTGITIPSSTITFAKGSGEVVGYTSGSDTFGLKNTLDGSTKTIKLNRFGVVTQAQ